MSKVSIIIPARNESPENLRRTVESIHENATGEYEIIIGFDGPCCLPLFYLTDDRIKYAEFSGVVGIKTNINAMAAMATGKYIYKSDAHCAFGKGFDEILQADMEEDWIVMPRFKIIKDDWSIQMRDGQEEFYDYFYLCCPFTDPKGFRFKAGGHWPERTKERLGVLIDETPQIHGSGYFLSRNYYLNVLGGFPLRDSRGHGMEPINLALKNWLMGGKVIVNKNTWYGHLHQNSSHRGYPEDKRQTEYTYNQTATHWMANKEPGMLYDMNWFVNKKFPRMPTWTDNWDEKYKQWLINHK